MASPAPATVAARRSLAEAKGFADTLPDLLVEARLRMDPRRRDYALVNGRDYRLQPLDAAWALSRFPAVTPSGAASRRGSQPAA